MAASSASSSEQTEPFLLVTEDLVPSLPPNLPTTTTIDFSGLLTPPLILQTDLKEGCGGQLWPAGRVLAKYLLQLKMDELRGKTIVELGAGSGLVGLALGLHSPNLTAVHITDLAPMLPLLTKNISLNPLLSSVIPSVLSWGSHIPPSIPPHPDILLAADCVYFEPAFPLLLATMEELIGEETVCYFCFKKRRRADLGFVKMAKKVFAIKLVEDDPDK
ncbi:hypothetical protein MMC31_006185, partial [Peltigera leucophlebia]|nr:hypothetical protein [Peltigera leucophlebia]